jgi:butyrate kinase
VHNHRILVLIPKSTTTVIGVFHNERCIFKETIDHPEITPNIMDKVSTRKSNILSLVNDAGINLSKLHAVSSVGGLLRAVQGGTYQVNEAMLTDLKNSYNGKHASNLGGLIAFDIAEGLHIPAFIIDPPVVDEFKDVARYSGIPTVRRKSIFHALNQKAVARLAARAIHSTYDKVNFIVAHLGNGITIGAHQQGRVIDVNNGLDGDGPFSLERSGTIPSRALIELCYSGTYEKEELIHHITFEGGVKAYLSIETITELEDMIKANHQKANTILNVMGYQIAKDIGAMSTVLKGNVDGIVLTGECAHSKLLTDQITGQINWIADVMIYPGEFDLQALNAGTLRVLREEEDPITYQP